MGAVGRRGLLEIMRPAQIPKTIDDIEILETQPVRTM